MSITATATTSSVSVSATIYATLNVTNVLIEHYTTTASTTQTFAEFIGYALDDLYINLQGAGNLGHLSGLAATRKQITGWDSSTGVMTFSNALPAGYQITVIGKIAN